MAASTVRAALQARRGDEFGIAQTRGHGARDQRIAFPQQQPQHQHHHGQGRAHHRHHGQRPQDDGQRQARGDQERHDAVDGAAEVAGHDAQRRADQPAHQRDGQADQRRDAYAVQGAGQDVAAQLVGAQDVVPVAAFAPDG
ncbi:hypothetical protein G6F65_021227 [Rhizopus arrhizus]|nr:hypothetical protein G6F65_021227 [Rhizopus arrhizus]